ncbi:copper resistance CopC/CopD family protein [Streptomyces orinoci]|uniref:FixH family protein n=1 Tax=Streptomyces orinoci TaxID=67339 RepID=A0ABV3K1T0_STRON|nr:FixH family protein [Streptomyces orinoci]
MRTTAAGRIAALLGTFLAALLCTLTVGAGTAAAHAALVATDPKSGSVLPSAPQRVQLTFSEGVLLSADSVRVLDPQGKRVDEGRPAHSGGRTDTAEVALNSGIADGTYTVAWQAVSADSHPVAGAFTFSVGAPSKTVVKAAAATTDPLVGTLYGIGRYTAYGGFALLAGAGVFAGVCRSSRPVQRVAVGGWVALFAATGALLLLRGAYTGGKGLGSVADLSLLGDALSTKPGAAMLCRLVLLSAAAVFLAVLFGGHAREGAPVPGDRRAVAWGLGAGGALVAGGLAATWSLAEHASVGIQPWLAMPADILHLLAVAVWLGGLAALLAVLRAGEPIERAAVRRFSALAFGAVCVLVVTGLYQSWRQVGSWDALTGTGYGRWLLVKIGLVAVLVGLGWFSRRWTAQLTDRSPLARPRPATRGKSGGSGRPVGAGKPAEPAEAPRTTGERPTGVRAAQLALQQAALAKAAEKRQRDADPGRSGLRRSVLAETAVAVVLLAVTTVLTGTQPGRAETEQRQAAAAQAPAGPARLRIGYDTGGTNGKGTAYITMDPARPGGNTLDVRLTDPAGRPMDVAELGLSFTQQTKNIGPLRAPLAHQAAGHWRATGFQLPMGGQWQLTLTVRTSEIDQVTETGNVKIANG